MADIPAQDTTPSVEDDTDDIRPSNLPMQTVRPDVYVPIANDTSAKRRRAISLTTKLALFIGLLVGILAWNLWVLQPFFVDGESMSPTLNTRDTLLVSKFPQTWAGLTNSRYIPARYAVVVVRNPQEPSERFVKRVIGLPGERIVIRDGVITVYNERTPRGEDVTLPPCCQNLETTSGTVDTFVREGHIFVVGDNRAPGGSIDSRASLGQIPSRDIIGRAVIRITPVTQIKAL
ncbi:signal peptidase I [Patescibacteria group bacterium]|nr:MAG: signal peptidase I [Patescibacteria group bacterium]